MTDVLTVRGLGRTFGHGRDAVMALTGLDLDLPRGGGVALVGGSGSGKTTAARCIVGLERPTSGTVQVHGVIRRGRPGAAERQRRARQLQMVFQDPYSSLNPRRTVASVLAQALRLAGRTPDAGGVADLMDLVGLPRAIAESRPRPLSGGQRQRLAIARALAAGADVLVLDEAVSALDVSVQAQILNLLADLRAERGIALLFISHDLAAVRQVTSEVIVLHRGQVVERGPVDRVLASPEDPYTAHLLAALPRPGWDPERIARRPTFEEAP